jgi:hypothetical protein
VGGDIILLTQRGLVSMAGQLVSTKVNGGVNAVNSDKVQLLISALVSEVNDLLDWELFYNAANNLFMINIPSAVLGGNRQLAANLVTDKAPWCFFTGVDSATWTNFNNEPYFGDYEGRVLKFWDGSVDELSLDGLTWRGITTEVQQAYSYLGAPAAQKQIGMYRPNFIVGGTINYNSKIEYDFTVQPIRFPATYPTTPLGAVWDVDKWDQGRWGGGAAGDRRWMQAIGIGVAASLRMAMKSETEALWVSTDYSHRVGGIL